jgi:aminocarboxymuconate-semialdehyde decarboxylase
MAELCLKYRDRFVAAIALLPMNNIDAALKETDRAIKDLGFKGIYVHSNINGKPLDAPEFLPLWEKIAKYDLPVYIHPWRPPEFSDYAKEKESKYNIAGNFGWPYETTVAMTRIIFSGILDKYPNLKIVTHHCGGMVSFYAGRIYQHYGSQKRFLTNVTKTPLEYYKMFYNDTAIHGNTPALMLAYDFWGPNKLVFGADLPLGDFFWGGRSYRATINAINAMNIIDEDKKKIFVDNTVNLLRIPL